MIIICQKRIGSLRVQGRLVPENWLAPVNKLLKPLPIQTNQPTPDVVVFSTDIRISENDRQYFESIIDGAIGWYGGELAGH